uniref:Conserved domain protein n=1 Tax=Rhabditophanes sp. KR3021 TaxID=114890 RepID=A0AC35UEE9_9BILA
MRLKLLIVIIDFKSKYVIGSEVLLGLDITILITIALYSFAKKYLFKYTVVNGYYPDSTGRYADKNGRYLDKNNRCPDKNVKYTDANGKYPDKKGRDCDNYGNYPDKNQHVVR